MALQEIVLKPKLKDPNVWIRAETRTDGYKHYRMLLVYVDDIMIIYHLGYQAAQKTGDFYKTK